ncbi:hypothetical protein KDW_50740 [Dictyobacter vulcani]|uniref:Uncharacterized protein n=1 Tax=Dictyobacter vulcani TaxID=2607529 RepID=A0A5J4KUM3_9CHLR|nr:hypothetical protein [Dictyobacter vulcani]GER90912.1 hypothetical protein KDW_50740 [Dictyobacter vulcani]
MSEKKLFASTNAGKYAIGSAYGPDIVEGQVLKILLGGQWLSGRVRIRHNHDAAEHMGSAQSVDAYATSSLGKDDVVEASEESFPASDAPAWTDERSASPQSVANSKDTYYFVADKDGSIYDLAPGMQIQTQ